uniref:CCHC-type domain-containing protein n=1 Tax=Trichuris muris TaxID=70415 RepID=A0A5S6QTI9_TRIMR
MPRSRVARSSDSRTPCSKPFPVPSENQNSPNADLQRACDLLANVSEKLDRVVLSVDANALPSGQNVKVEGISHNLDGMGVSGQAFDGSTVSSGCPPYVQVDNSWFESHSSSGQVNTGAPNPWLQKLVPAANIEVFDGDPRSWPRFIAGFKSMVHDSLSSDVDRLAVLAQLLSPRLREGFAGLLSSPVMYQRVVLELQHLYGDPMATVQSHPIALTEVAPLRSESLEELERFYLQVNGPVSVLEMSRRHNELNSIVLVGQVSRKLTRNLREKWANQLRLHSPDTVNLRNFVNWIRELVIEKRLAAAFVNDERIAAPSNSPKGRGGSRAVTGAKGVRSTVVISSHHCIVCEADSHSIGSCPSFSKMDMADRLAVVREKRLCIRCLRLGHVKRNCISKRKCSVSG